jgi:hypothetical protein
VILSYRHLFKITEVAQIFSLLLFSGKSYVSIFDIERVGLHFGAIFSQTHLVTWQQRPCVLHCNSYIPPPPPPPKQRSNTLTRANLTHQRTHRRSLEQERFAISPSPSKVTVPARRSFWRENFFRQNYSPKFVEHKILIMIRFLWLAAVVAASALCAQSSECDANILDRWHELIRPSKICQIAQESVFDIEASQEKAKGSSQVKSTFGSVH